MRLMMLVSYQLFWGMKYFIGNSESGQAIELDPTYAKAYYRCVHPARLVFKGILNVPADGEYAICRSLNTHKRSPISKRWSN